jgi:hypothetical protein
MKLISATRTSLVAAELRAGPVRSDHHTHRHDDAFHRDTVKDIQHAWRTRDEGQAKPWLIVFSFGLI